MNRSKYNNDIYSMYEEECLKLKKIEQENRNLKLENSNLKYELEYKIKVWKRR